MIAVYCDKEEYRHDWPQVGKVVDVTDDDISIHWFSAGENVQCTPLTKTNANGKRVAWVDSIHKSCIITNPFRLTKRKILPKTIINQLDLKFRDFFD